MTLYISLTLSLLVNALLLWYLSRLLRKFYFISERLSDLFLTTKAFRVFAGGLYGMDSYHGEPIIQELVHKIREVTEEIDNFRDIFEYTLDEEMEEELDAAEEAQEVK
tara:strand:+ start:60 stop:383 length:324 start_codon:yes stop_codon:yes gene_type:complete